MFVATLIAAGKLTGEVVREAIDRLDATEHEVGAPHWIDQGDAADIFFQGSLVSARAELAKMDHGALDVVVQPLGDRTKKLIIPDMDSTMITVECIDELADYAGIKPQIAAITERAMRGELDFRAALIERVGLLGGAGQTDPRRAHAGPDDEGAWRLVGAGVGRFPALCRAGRRSDRL